jgi:transcriptional regulator with XRE-family HTH domain
MPAEDVDGVGARIARLRKLRHFTQVGLAAQARVSQGMISQVERGRKQPSPAVVAAIARALSVPVTDLTGQPYLAELRQEQLDGLIQPIREALDVYDLGADPQLEPRPLDALAADAERMCRLVRAADLRTVAAELPALLTETTSTVHAAPSDRAWSTLASAYRSSYDIATKLGFFDLASIALDRMAWAAERGSDPGLAALRQYLRALGYLRAGQFRTGRRLADIGQKTAALAPPDRTRDAITGQMHLGAAVLAARDMDGDTAMEHIKEAKRIAERTGEATHIHYLSFGPTNTAVHHASILIEQHHYAEALAVAKTIRVPEDWPASRAAHHHAEIARAQLWTGRTDAAFRSLLTARRLAPQQTRYSPTVRATAYDLQRAKRATTDTLANFVAWLGM